MTQARPRTALVLQSARSVDESVENAFLEDPQEEPLSYRPLSADYVRVRVCAGTNVLVSPRHLETACVQGLGLLLLAVRPTEHLM